MISVVLGMNQKKTTLINFGQQYTGKLSQSKLWHIHFLANIQVATTQLIEER